MIEIDISIVIYDLSDGINSYGTNRRNFQLSSGVRSLIGGSGKNGKTDAVQSEYQTQKESDLTESKFVEVSRFVAE